MSTTRARYKKSTEHKTDKSFDVPEQSMSTHVVSKVGFYSNATNGERKEAPKKSKCICQ